MRRLAVLLATVCVTTLLPVSTAGADSPVAGRPTGAEPWEPYIQQEFTAAAGRFCSFPLQLKVLEQDIRKRVLERYPDGSIKREEYAGPLVVAYVNGDTGASVERDTGGRGFPQYRTDGTFLRYTSVGPVGFGIREGDDFPKGYYVVDGIHVMEFAADGRRSFSVRRGPEENVCEALGD
ncbi:hypothetical protein ABT009_42840 [Streptomyces sp. NPDC002896]|uniref:hypothetical protein n=1 Tax=Streptomyces sp. NPDC002896 TaxID=3154438 RepID=UPI00331DDB3F